MKIMIGLESHVQLENCKTKLFCSCPTSGSEIPNTRTCPTCLGLPGSKPSLNKEALTEALKVALSLNCKINSSFFFSRKTYFYNDLPNSYQITQYELPLSVNGKLNNIRIRRIHLEEDPGKLIHENNYTLIDYNRSGTPLIEIVTEPDFTSLEQVRSFLQKLTIILEYLGVYTRKSEASLRTDANISIDNNPRVEIKNITGIIELIKALEYEIQRQVKIINSKEKLEQHTRMWDPTTKTTTSVRTKETEEDYGYIIEPNLTKIELTEKQIEEIKSSLPELAEEKTKRFIKQYKMKEDDAKIITSDLTLANLFEKVAKKIDHKLTTRWFVREIPRILNYNKITLEEWKITEKELTELLDLLENNKITETTAQKILEELSKKIFSPEEYVKKQNLELLSSSSDIKKLCDEAIRENPKAVQDYKSGNKIALNFIFGQVMKKTKGTADPYKVKEILSRKLS
ncbi:Asp-tRNA(Asn)/Glu-tRNA(Gln) amidotransferase subunit GatB [Candidatus Woesearchaeota archaeon]|nr:Asp-tRNA(Asn)/Glu-tRNA(Gln) amidotransferase subunit GatB [Candidatus Woesearchaeota archaeon]